MDRLRHYFLTYKQKPGEPAQSVEITHVYGRDGCWQSHALPLVLEVSQLPSRSVNSNTLPSSCESRSVRWDGAIVPY